MKITNHISGYSSDYKLPNYPDGPIACWKDWPSTVHVNAQTLFTKHYYLDL